MIDGIVSVIAMVEEALIAFDVLAIGALAAALTIYFFTLGKDHGVIALIATYLAAATMTFLPFIHDIAVDFLLPYQVHILLFTLLIPAFAFLQMRNGYFEPSIVPSGWENIVFAILTAGVYGFVVIGFLPAESTAELSDLGKTLFLLQPWSNLWFTLPILTLLFLKGDT